VASWSCQNMLYYHLLTVYILDSSVKLHSAAAIALVCTINHPYCRPATYIHKLTDPPPPGTPTANCSRQASIHCFLSPFFSPKSSANYVYTVASERHVNIRKHIFITTTKIDCRLKIFLKNNLSKNLRLTSWPPDRAKICYYTIYRLFTFLIQVENCFLKSLSHSCVQSITALLSTGHLHI